MSLLTLLYNFIIYPPVQIIEFAYVLFYKIFRNTSIAIIGVSAAVTFLCLPLYIVAEKWQEKERDTQKRMAPMINNIKAVFRGDERFMILQEFYRQNNYRPIYALRSSFGVLIQIPFFIAAYTYLSHLEALKGVHFLFIHNLGAPDALTHFGGFTVNILPILMTVINIASGMLYSKGFPLKEKVQLYIIAAVFLILLYNSPAALVIYWTMNNILSLIKNIFYKLKNPLKVFYVCISILIIALIINLIFFNTSDIRKRALLSIVFALILFIPLYIRAVRYILKNWLSVLSENKQALSILYFFGSISITLLMGLCIPSMVISSSPQEFSFIDNYKAPWIFILNALLRSAGFFFLWPAAIYFLYKQKVRIIMSLIFSILGIFAIVNAFGFQGDYGKISNTLLFDSPGVLTVSKLNIALNIFVFIVITAFFFLFIRFRKTRVVNSVMAIALCFLGVFSVYNMIIIGQGYKQALALQEASGGSIHQISPIFSLSKTQKNVIVLMEDASINGFVKPIFAEHPQLEQQFDGFTLYPNTVSYGSHTILGCPPIYGGYEYTPLEINKKANQTMLDKHNEALKMLPTLFKNTGFDVSVADQSFANYSYISDLSIYNNTGIKTFTTIKMYTNLWFMEHQIGEDNITSAKIMRNFFWFAALKVSPTFLRLFVYDGSVFWSPENQGNSIVNFINSYAVLDYLPRLFSYEATAPEALFLTNEAIHESIMLQYPDYIPVANVTETGNGKYSQNKVYQSSNAVYLKLGEFLDVLKENGVYDNTRIIIVSDHGSSTDAGITGDVPFLKLRREAYNPLLLVKDFNSHGPLKTDMSFMTNADVPVLAAKNIISNPVNPFTKNPLTMDPKKNGVTITTNNVFMPYQHGKYQFRITDDQWVSVHDNIFDPANWSQGKK